MENGKLRMHNLIFLVIILSIVHCPLSIPSTYAIESTKSAKQATSSSSLIDKLDALKKEIASKAAQIKKEVNKDIQNKAFVGNIEKLEQSSIILKTHRGLKTVRVDEYTIYQSLPKGGPSQDDFVAALGDVDDKGVLSAKKIIKFKKPQIDKSTLVWGKIFAANKGVVNLRNKDKQTIKVLTSQKTVFKLGTTDASFADAKLNKVIVARGILKENQLTADFIYILKN